MITRPGSAIILGLSVAWAAAAADAENAGHVPFKAPKATIVTDPNFRVRGTWGGESDGKTIGSDGKPLAEHHIYANDCYHFTKRLDLGLRKLLTPDDLGRFGELCSLALKQDAAARKREADMYKARYRVEPGQEPLYALARLKTMLDLAKGRYDGARGQLNYREKLTVSSRIDLDATPNAEGTEARQTMERAIMDMYKARQGIMKRFGKFYAAGAKLQQAQHTAGPGGAGWIEPSGFTRMNWAMILPLREFPWVAFSTRMRPSATSSRLAPPPEPL